MWAFTVVLEHLEHKNGGDWVHCCREIEVAGV